MSETLATVREHMSAADLLAQAASLGRRLDGGRVHFSIMSFGGGEGPAYATVYPYGDGTPGGVETFHAPDWPTLIEKVGQWVDNHTRVLRDKLIRKMALAIVELTDEHGKCTVEMLERRGIARQRITALHAAASARASEMANNAPFTVVF